MAAMTPRVTVDDNEVQARVHVGSPEPNLWITNATLMSCPV